MERVPVCRTSKLYPLLLGLKDHRSHQRIQKEITKHMCLPHHFRATLKATEITGIRIADLKNYQESQFLKSTTTPHHSAMPVFLMALAYTKACSTQAFALAALCLQHPLLSSSSTLLSCHFLCCLSLPLFPLSPKGLFSALA